MNPPPHPSCENSHLFFRTNPSLRNATLDNDNETINDPSDTEIIIEDLLPDTIENGDDNIDVNGTDNCDINESYNVLNSTTYIMTSGQDSSSHAEISLQLIQQSSTKLNFGNKDKT